MSIIKVSQVGTKFAVTEDGDVIPNSSFDTRGEAVRFAIQYKEAN